MSNGKGWKLLGKLFRTDKKQAFEEYRVALKEYQQAQFRYNMARDRAMVEASNQL